MLILGAAMKSRSEIDVRTNRRVLHVIVTEEEREVDATLGEVASRIHVGLLTSTPPPNSQRCHDSIHTTPPGKGRDRVVGFPLPPPCFTSERGVGIPPSRPEYH